MGHVAKADGRVSEQEIAAARGVMEALRLNPEQVRLAIGYFGEGKQPDFALDAELAELRAAAARLPAAGAVLHGDPAAGIARRQRTRAAAACAPAARGELCSGLTSDDFGRLESPDALAHGAAGAEAVGGAGAGRTSRRTGSAQAYALLETAPVPRDEQVVKAYRRQMSRNHPDKLQANGLPESMLERAKERTQQIQAAYELMRSGARHALSAGPHVD